jgi:hypothetical protein
MLLCLTPDNFTRQEESADAQWVNTFQNLIILLFYSCRQQLYIQTELCNMRWENIILWLLYQIYSLINMRLKFYFFAQFDRLVWKEQQYQRKNSLGHPCWSNSGVVLWWTFHFFSQFLHVVFQSVSLFICILTFVTAVNFMSYHWKKLRRNGQLAC